MFWMKSKQVRTNMEPTKEELMHAIENIGETCKEKILLVIEDERKRIKEQELADKHADMEKKLCKQLDAENIKWSGDMSGAHYIDGFGVIVTVEEIKSEVSNGPVYAVGYYDVDENRAPEGEPLKTRLTDCLDDVISWAIEAISCPFCHSRQLEDSPQGLIVCVNCGNSWR